MRSRRRPPPPRHAGAQVISTQMADGYEPPSAALYYHPDPSRAMSMVVGSELTGHHTLRCGPDGGEVARPPRRPSRWQQWRRKRACRRLTHHCWHPADAMIEWFCCMCGGDIDGMPAQRCTMCAGQRAARLDQAEALAMLPAGTATSALRWPICTPEGEFAGGVWCASEECPCAAENSEIGDFQQRTFTIADLHEAIAAHVAAQREREAAP